MLPLSESIAGGIAATPNDWTTKYATKLGKQGVDGSVSKDFNSTSQPENVVMQHI
jgi:hypothetical protein